VLGTPLGVVVGTMIGTRLPGRVPPRRFRPAMAVLLVLLGAYTAVAGRG
jgi:uncharacterized membrane protein YfcA